jgi:hypothetical protein
MGGMAGLTRCVGGVRAGDKGGVDGEGKTGCDVCEVEFSKGFWLTDILVVKGVTKLSKPAGLGTLCLPHNDPWPRRHGGTPGVCAEPPTVALPTVARGI